MGPEDARGQDSWIQVSYFLVGPMFRWEGLGLTHLGREGLRGLDFGDQGLWKSQFLT